jgi:hypothetical protein
VERLLRRIPSANAAARASPIEALVRAAAAAGDHAAAAEHALELRAIADAVSTTPLLGAANRHVANIHAKLSCSSRAAAVALAHRRELL